VVVFDLVRWIVVRLLRRDLPIPDRELMPSGACVKECPNPSDQVVLAAPVVLAAWVALLVLVVVPAVLVAPAKAVPWVARANFAEVLAAPAVLVVLVVPSLPSTLLACANLRKSPKT
jgi:hypothetical protein